MITCFQVQQLGLLGVLSAKEITEPFRKIKKQESMVWDKMGCIVISNLVISLYWRESTVRAYYHVLVKQFNDLLWRGGANYVLFPLKSDTLLAVLLCFVDIIALQNSAWPCRQFWGATMTVNIDTISMRRTWPARFRECITPLIKHGISLLFLLPLYWTLVSYLSLWMNAR